MLAGMALTQQHMHLLSLLEESPQLCNNRSFLQGETAAQRRAQWDRIAASLNAIGPLHKDGKGWQQLWKDWRYRVRARAREMTRRMQATGGGSGLVVTDEGATPVDIASHMSGTDQRILALVGWDMVAGMATGVEITTSGAVEEAPVAGSSHESEPV